MNTKTCAAIAATILQSTVLISGIAADPAGLLAGGTSWTANPNLVAQLREPRNVGHWHLRIPAGCKLKQPISKGALVTDPYWWPVRKDKSVCVMGVTRYDGEIATPNGEEAKLREFLDNVDAQTIDGKPKLQTSTPEYRFANGVPTLRQYFSFFDPHSHETDHGLIYLFLDDRGFISVAGLDAEPYSNKTLPLIEAAALTVRDK